MARAALNAAVPGVAGIENHAAVGSAMSSAAVLHIFLGDVRPRARRPFDLNQIGRADRRRIALGDHHHPPRHGIGRIIKRDTAEIPLYFRAAVSSTAMTFEPLRVGGSFGRAYTMFATLASMP